jgi:hypothetical protein
MEPTALQDYLKFTEKTASPESYHVWAFLSMVGTILGKKAWVKFGYFNIYPNLYVVLASPPGIGKKSTAIDISNAIIRDAYPDPKTRPSFSNDNQTSQALIGEMEKSVRVWHTENDTLYRHSSLTVIADELVSLLSQGAPMVDFLTTIYSKDKEFEYRTKNKGNNTIINPCLNILAGCTTDTFNSKVMKDATAGGLLSRCDVIYDNKTRSSSMFDTLSPEQEKARERVVERMWKLGDIFGEFTFTEDAKELFKEFEKKEELALKQNTMNAEFRSRKPTKTIKVAMLLAASELTKIIDKRTMEIAIEIMNRVEYNMKFIYMSSGTHKNAQIHFKIMSALGMLGESISYGQILEHFMGDADEEEIEKAVNVLAKTGFIKLYQAINVSGNSEMMIGLTEKGKIQCQSQ